MTDSTLEELMFPKDKSAANKRMPEPMEKSKNKKVQFIVVREFSGEKTMQEAFEQVIERQTCEQFEKWLENHETEQKAA